MIASEDPNLTLRKLASQGADEKIQELQKKSVLDINAVGPASGNTAAHFAAKRGHISTLSLLMQQGANFSIANKQKKTAIDCLPKLDISSLLQLACVAVKTNQPVQTLRTIIQLGGMALIYKCYLSMMDPDNRIANKYKAELNRQIDNHVGKGGCIEAPEEFVDRIVELSKIHYKDKTDWAYSPHEIHEMTATAFNSWVTCHPNLVNKFIGGWPLIPTIYLRNNPEVRCKCDLLLKLGVNPNAKLPSLMCLGVFENTALHTLIANESLNDANEFIELVKQHDKAIDPTVKDIEDKTTLLLAAKMRRGDFARLLLKKNYAQIVINEPDEDGNTPLHYAYALGCPDMVELFESYTADASSKNNAGLTPIEMLDHADNTKISGILWSVSIDPGRDADTQKNSKSASCQKKSLITDCMNGVKTLRSKPHTKKGDTEKKSPETSTANSLRSP